MKMSDALQNLEREVEARSRRRGLKVDLEKLSYSNNALFKNARLPQSARLLYVGVGHGHDAILALLSDKAHEIIGVDPYIESHGNGDEDYRSLMDLISSLNLTERFKIYRGTIQEYLDDAPDSFNAVVCPDVLHHIFVTPQHLTKTSDGSAATALFRHLRNVTSLDGLLLISDTSRHGLRPWLFRAGVLKGEVDYSTKQSWREWVEAAERAGWSLISMTNYVPWALKNYTFLLEGVIGQYTACDRYFVTLRHNN